MATRKILLAHVAYTFILLGTILGNQINKSLINLIRVIYSFIPLFLIPPFNCVTLKATIWYLTLSLAGLSK